MRIRSSLLASKECMQFCGIPNTHVFGVPSLGCITEQDISVLRILPWLLLEQVLHDSFFATKPCITASHILLNNSLTTDSNPTPQACTPDFLPL